MNQSNILSIQKKQSPRVLSGMRPTGALHLGHYHGALKNWLLLSDKSSSQNSNLYDCFFMVADWHGLTTHYDEISLISPNTIEMVIDWLAVGLDPDHATFFVQSHIPEHAELFLAFSMMTPLSWLERVPTYKEQQQKLTHKDLATYGFLGYPLLQAADILLYQGNFVPVGEDQLPHIELTREVGRRFNHLFQKELFVEPQGLLTAQSKMVGLDGEKMSKSYGNTIAIREPIESITQKIKRMPTDPARVRKTDAGNPDKCPVWKLHQVYTDEQTRQELSFGCQNATIGCIACKTPLIDAIICEQKPFLERSQPFIAEPQKVIDIIHRGTKNAREIASQTMKEVKNCMGLMI